MSATEVCAKTADPAQCTYRRFRVRVDDFVAQVCRPCRPAPGPRCAPAIATRTPRPTPATVGLPSAGSAGAGLGAGGTCSRLEEGRGEAGRAAASTALTGDAAGVAGRATAATTVTASPVAEGTALGRMVMTTPMATARRAAPSATAASSRWRAPPHAARPGRPSRPTQAQASHPDLLYVIAPSVELSGDVSSRMSPSPLMHGAVKGPAPLTLPVRARVSTAQHGSDVLPINDEA
jgi:hypothetical protein